MQGKLHIGLMLGTSLDGIDAVLADFDAPNPLIASHFVAMPDALRAEFLALLHSSADELARSQEAALALSGCYAEAVHTLLRSAAVDETRVHAIGCHGQTVRHQPERGYTVQLVNGARLAELTGMTVVCDFRSRDIAAGGQGAPLVPAFHSAVFRAAGRHRAIVNLGGIANITDLPPVGLVRGFDCGPGNALLDEWIAACLGRPYDADGDWAASGTVLADLRDRLLSAPYFALVPPKSTGREQFNLAWLQAQLQDRYRPQDVQATLAEVSARGVADAIARHLGPVTEVYVCGGGASNRDLMDRLARLLPGRSVASTAALGIAPDWVEALAFAWLARETLTGRPGNLPAVTGARGPRVLGCIYPA